MNRWSDEKRTVMVLHIAEYSMKHHGKDLVKWARGQQIQHDPSIICAPINLVWANKVKRKWWCHSNTRLMNYFCFQPFVSFSFEAQRNSSNNYCFSISKTSSLSGKISNTLPTLTKSLDLFIYSYSILVSFFDLVFMKVSSKSLNYKTTLFE